MVVGKKPEEGEKLLYEVVSFDPAAGILKVKVLRGRVEEGGEYEIAFTENGVSYRFCAVPLGREGNVLTFRVKEAGIPSSGKVDLSDNPVPSLVCTPEGFCVRGVCTAFSPEGAELELPPSVDGEFKKLLKEGHPLEVKFRVGEEVFEVKAYPTSFEENGRLVLLFGIGGENRNALKVYDLLRKGRGG